VSNRLPESPVNEAWVAEVLATPKMREWRAIPAVGRARLGARSLTLKRVPAYGDAIAYLWYVTEHRAVVAAGTAIMHTERGHVLEIGASVVRADRRGQGIYGAVLRALRRLFGGPIESDTAVAPGAAAAWRRMGGVPAERRGSAVLRINPTLSGGSGLVYTRGIAVSRRVPRLRPQTYSGQRFDQAQALALYLTDRDRRLGQRAPAHGYSDKNFALAEALIERKAATLRNPTRAGLEATAGLEEISRRVSRDVALERAGFTPGLAAKLSHVASRRRPQRSVPLTPSEQAVVRRHFNIDDEGWFDWSGAQLVITKSGGIWKIG
jgi:hypothetical protein